MIIQAKYALVEPDVVYRDVRLEIDGTRIAAITQGQRYNALRPDIDFGMAVITPGLVNPHAHLELEFCRDRIGYNGSFTNWLQQIRDLKKSSQSLTTAPEQTLDYLLRSGCTTVVDHHTTHLDWEEIHGTGLRYVPVREFFQFNNHNPDVSWMQLQAQRAMGPHAPYTASIETARACREFDNALGLPMSLHLSEIEEEITFIRDGVGDSIIELNRVAGAGDDSWQGTGQSPIAYYARQNLFSGPTYAVHVNYLDQGDLEILAAHQPTVVYCPRSHAYFKHPPHPVMSYLDAGINVAIGTDSLASNDVLSPLAEAAQVRKARPDVPVAQLFKGITTAGLIPLGWSGYLGQVHTGFLADLAVYPLDGNPGGDFTALFDAVVDRRFATATLINGQLLYCDRPEIIGAISR